jgi:DNA-directed RNA polymerase subunit H (RpoH/RPB5)
MSELEDVPQDHSKVNDCAVLSEEENRCLTYLKKYYTTFEELPEQAAAYKAWEDLKREIPRLAQYKRYK